MRRAPLSRRGPISPPTSAAVSVARCQRSWWSVSATAAPKRRWRWALSELSSLRLPLRLPFSGKWRWISRRQTKLNRASARSGERLLDLLCLVDLDHIALLHVRVVLEHEAALESRRDLADVVL